MSSTNTPRIYSTVGITKSAPKVNSIQCTDDDKIDSFPSCDWLTISLVSCQREREFTALETTIGFNADFKSLHFLTPLHVDFHALGCHFDTIIQWNKSALREKMNSSDDVNSVFLFFDAIIQQQTKRAWWICGLAQRWHESAAQQWMNCPVIRTAVLYRPHLYLLVAKISFLVEPIRRMGLRTSSIKSIVTIREMNYCHAIL